MDISDSDTVVVIGGGNAALCAAMTAAEAGSDVLMIESAPKALRGGNTKYTRDIRYMHEEDIFTGGSYEFGEFFEDLMKVSGGLADRTMAEFTIRNSRDIPQWMSDHGIIFKREIQGTLNLNRTNVFFMGGGKALINDYYERAQKLGIRIIYEATATDISILDGAFEDVTVKTPHDHLKVKGKSLVVASGGFEANMEWLSSIWGEKSAGFQVRGSRFNTGLPLRSLIHSGAETVGDPKGGHMVAVDSRGPKFDGGIVTRIDAIPWGIVVNLDGVRFYDEGEDIWPKRYAIWGKLIAEQKGQKAFAIIDSSTRRKFMPTAFEPLVSNTIEGLAAKAEFNRDNFIRTVKEYNAAASDLLRSGAKQGSFDASADSIVPRKSHFYSPLEKPPFYLYPLSPGLTFTYMGLKVDQNSAVISGGRNMRNVFAAGEIMSGNILRSGYLAGFGLTIGTVFGRIAGKEASSL